MTLAEPRAKAARIFATADDHWYVEPADCTSALLTVERFSGPVWDPACGGGNVVTACRAAGLDAFGTDLVDRGWDLDGGLFHGEQDFLSVPPG